ncbi:SH3 domain-containing protein [Ruminococcus sp.]|uniref:SH3 domain-containing protein n=1 Tax=Ruminococcus sp. TaxID=41978 RepID=UPI0025ECB28B|nr:SH3 domain-containing protein [Ruminococcus sp.]
MAIFKCKICGGSLDIPDGITVCECEYCGTRQTLPKISDEQKISMFNRANHFRQQCEFDKAAEIYEKLAAESENDADLFWSLVLCRYGIEYVDDPVTKGKIPTSHRAQYKSILEDPDYHTALECADTIQRKFYEQEAFKIFNIQKGIIEISNKEQPYDVFICYKETDENGRRTPDSVLAQDLYYGLTHEGFKVFFSRITLESKLGTEYEPYIFAALNSSKVMVVVGTKPEYFNAVWVRNEWSRYLQLMQDDRSKIIIPAYKDMDPYDLPDSLSLFQSQDMSKIGFLQDLIRGIKKIVNHDDNKSDVDIGRIITESRAPQSDSQQAVTSDFVKSSASKSNLKALLTLASVFVIGVGVTGGFFMLKNKDIGVPKASINHDANISEDTVPVDNNKTDVSSAVKATEVAIEAPEVQAEKPVVDKQAVKDAYVKKLTEFTTTDDFNAYDHASKYALYDIDNDGVEELIIQYAVLIGNVEKLYYYKNGEYSEIASCAESSFEICPESHCVQSYGYGGYCVRRIMYISAQGNTKDELYIDHDQTCIRNNVGISQSEYNQVMSKYDAMNWVCPSFNTFSNVLPDSIVYAKPKETYAFLGAVNTSSDVLNVRESPSTESKILGGLPRGTIVRVYRLDGNNEWYKIECDEKNLKGYAYAQFIVDSDTFKKIESEYADENTMIAKGRTVLNDGGVLNVREAPSTDSEIVTTIPKGHYVGIFSSTGDWYYIKYYADTNSPIYYGYVSSQFIEITQTFR